MSKIEPIDDTESEYANFSRKASSNFEMLGRTTVASHNADLSSLSLHQLVIKGKLSLLEQVIEQYSNRVQKRKRLNAKDEKENTPLHYAARYHDYEIMALLINNGANVNAEDEDDLTPLHFLCKYNLQKALDNKIRQRSVHASTGNCVELLVQNGAKVNAKDSSGLTALHIGCAKGNTDVIKELMEVGAIDLELGDNQGMTALHFACLYGNYDVVQMLTNKGCQLMPKDKDATTPLHLACIQGNLDIVKLFFDKAKVISKLGRGSVVGMKRNEKVSTEEMMLYERDDDQNLPVHLAVENQHIDIVNYLVNLASDKGIAGYMNEKQQEGLTSLHLAVRANNQDLVKLALKEGADVDCQDGRKAAPLFLACQMNFVDVAKYLIDMGANIETKDVMSMTPLLVAAKNGHGDVVRVLLDSGADINETDRGERTCLLLASEENRIEVIQMLMGELSGKKMLLDRDKYNNTPLHLAALKGNEESVKMLLELEAPLDVKNTTERCPLHMAASSGFSTIIPQLGGKEHSIINMVDEEGNSALHLAAIDGNSQCVHELINLGINIEITNSKEWTALDCAAANGREKVAKMLLQSGATIESTGKIKVSSLHLACKRGHPGIVNLLLQWDASLTFKSSNGRNALDFALDFSHKDCVLPIIKHESWELSLKNAIFDNVTGKVDTPMRKLIRKMPDMAEIVLDRCISDNGKRPIEDGFTVKVLYKYLDDTYACTEWLTTTNDPKQMGSGGNVLVGVDDAVYSVYEPSGKLTEMAYSYDTSQSVLKENHPLKIMIAPQCRQLLVHPLVTSLLRRKWSRFGRYVYYSNLLVYVVFLILLNVYALLLPRFYTIDWVELATKRKDLLYAINATGTQTLNCQGNNTCTSFKKECLVLRGQKSCHQVDNTALNLRLVIFFYSVIKITFEVAQNFRRLTRVKPAKIASILLYVLTILLTLNFHYYHLYESKATSSGNVDETFLQNLQEDTGLRQEWQEKIAAFAVFLSWTYLLLLLQKVPLIPSLGIFVIMLQDTLKTFASFMLILIFFLVGFSFSFFILMGNQNVFGSIHESLITVFVMMVGEMDYGSRFFQNDSYDQKMFTRDASYLFFVIFVSVMTIIIMNLLVGLAVGDIMEVRDNATLQRLGLQINSVLDIEFILPQFVRKKFCVSHDHFEHDRDANKSVVTRMFSSKYHVPSELKNFTSSFGQDEDDDEQEPQAENEIDRVLTGLTALKSNVSEVLDDQEDIKLRIRKLGMQVVEVREEAKQNTIALTRSVGSAEDNLSDKIKSTHGDLKDTRVELGGAREQVDVTKQMAEFLKQRFVLTDKQISQVSSNLADKITSSREEISKRIRDQGKQMAEQQKVLERSISRAQLQQEAATSARSARSEEASGGFVGTQVVEIEGQQRRESPPRRSPGTGSEAGGELPGENRMRLIVSEAKSTLLQKMDAFERKDAEMGREVGKVKEAVARQGQQLEEMRARMEEAREEARRQSEDIKRALQRLLGGGSAASEE